MVSYRRGRVRPRFRRWSWWQLRGFASAALFGGRLAQSTQRHARAPRRSGRIKTSIRASLTPAGGVSPGCRQHVGDFTAAVGVECRGGLQFEHSFPGECLQDPARSALERRRRAAAPRPSAAAAPGARTRRRVISACNSGSVQQRALCSAWRPHATVLLGESAPSRQYIAVRKSVLVNQWHRQSLLARPPHLGDEPNVRWSRRRGREECAAARALVNRRLGSVALTARCRGVGRSRGTWWWTGLRWRCPATMDW